MMIYTISQFNQVKKERMELISQRVDFQKRLIDYWVEERAKDVRTLSRLDTFRILDEQQMEIALDLMQENKKDFDSLSYINRDGVFKISTLGAIQFSSAIGQPYFQIAMEGKDYISDVVIGRNSGLSIINFSSPIYDKNGIFQGIILGSVRTTTIESLLRENWIGETGEILLVNGNGLMIAEPRYSNGLVEKELETIPRKKAKFSAEILSKIQSGENGNVIWHDSLGKKVLGSYQYIPERGWTLIGSINEDEILASIYAQLGKMAGGTVILVLLLLPLATRFTNQIKKTIDWLSNQSNLIAAENYEMFGRDKSEKIPKELDNLCQSFLKMGSKIEKTVGTLKENEAKLEDKVLEMQNVNVKLEEEIIVRQKVQAALQQLNCGLENEVNQRTHELQKSEQQYRKLVENTPDIICQFDRNYRFIYVNPAFTSLTSISVDQIIDRTWAEAGMPKELYSLWVKNFDEVFRTGGAIEIEPWDGGWDKQRYYSIRFLPEFSQDDQVETILCIARDITEKLQLERKMAHLERLNIVGEMAAVIGHEVRNPMTTVRGYLQMFQKKAEFVNQYTQIVTMIDELDRANAIITEFLSLAKNKAVEIKRGNLNKTILALLPLLQADAFYRGHEINAECGNIIDNDFDEKEIRQLILNLVRNGIEAMEIKGKLTIRTYMQNGTIVLEVQDAGKGISDEVMEKLGTPFMTTKEGGTGLGLSVCYRIVDRHGAKINVETGRQGTTFSIQFIR
jgi:PAS domain S-box-containing protein